MSRRDRIREAGMFLGLSAARFACYGEGWREAGDYRNRSVEILDEISLNEAEFRLCRETAVDRAERYIRRAYRTPGKRLVPATATDALRLAVEDIDAILKPYRP